MLWGGVNLIELNLFLARWNGLGLPVFGKVTSNAKPGVHWNNGII